MRVWLPVAFAFLVMTGAASAERAIALYAFQGESDGSGPYAGVAVDNRGDIFGTTYFGGSNACPAGCGTLYALTPQGDGAWDYSVIYDFKGGSDGKQPTTALATDRAGNVYGEANPTGAGGEAFRVVHTSGGWSFETLYQFDAAKDGDLDTNTPLVPRGDDVLGLTYNGGTGCGTSGCGTLFELKPSKSGKWKHKILFDFPDGDGGPFWLVPSPDGSTYYAATFQNGGAILSLTRGGGGWTASELYRFTGGDSQPSNLAVGPDGTIFGIAMTADNRRFVFALSPPQTPGAAWTETVLHTFPIYDPPVSLTALPDGTLAGAVFGDQDGDPGFAFGLAPPGGPGGKWTYRTIYNFKSAGSPSQNPLNVVRGKGGHLYGALNGGGIDFGAVFELK
jgi:hypothetical protein